MPSAPSSTTITGDFRQNSGSPWNQHPAHRDILHRRTPCGRIWSNGTKTGNRRVSVATWREITRPANCCAPDRSRDPRSYRAPLALEVASDLQPQVEYLQGLRPRGGTADASVLGANECSSNELRREAHPDDNASYFAREANASSDAERTEAHQNGHPALPQALPGEYDQLTAIEAWEGLRVLAWGELPEPIRAGILAMVRASE